MHWNRSGVTNGHNGGGKSARLYLLALLANVGIIKDGHRCLVPHLLPRAPRAESLLAVKDDHCALSLVRGQTVENLRDELRAVAREQLDARRHLAQRVRHLRRNDHV